MTEQDRTVVDLSRHSCPVCKNKMVVAEMVGITIDVCEDHGVWLDKGELEEIANRAAGRAIAKTRKDHWRKVREAERKGKLAGTYLGLWSLLLD